MHTNDRPVRVVTAMLTGFALACGGGDAPATEEEAARATEEEAGDPLQAAADEMRRSMEQIGAGASVSEPIPFRELQRFLPEELGRLERTRSSGETSGMMGMSVSIAEATYESEDGQSIEVTITDLGAVAGPALMGMAAWANVKVDRETDDGYERTTRYKGYPAYEEFSSYGEGDRGSAQFMFMVEGRFMVELEGSDATMDEVKELGDEIDVGDLADLKDRSG